MVMFAEPVTDETIREAVRTWVALLSEDRYEEALDMLYQGDKALEGGIPPESGERWTPDLLRESVRYYGLFECELYAGYHEKSFRVIPVSDATRALFENELTIDWANDAHGWRLTEDNQQDICGDSACKSLSRTGERGWHLH